MRKWLWLFIPVLFSSCDPNRIFDENRDIAGGQWHFKDHQVFGVDLKDSSQYCNIYINLRIQGDYQYNNIYMLFHLQNPEGKTETKRVEMILANEKGEWTGSSTGGLHSYQSLVYKGVKLGKPGTYRFELEQNMRTDVLAGVKNVGVRVEKGEEQY